MTVYLKKKIVQVKNISWFCAGFGFGCGIVLLAGIALALAVALDVLCGWLSGQEA